MRVSAALVAFLAASVLTCSGLPGRQDAGTPTPDAGQPRQPIYGGGATDESWRAMVDAEDNITTDNMRGSTFITPTEGATVNGASPATFAWNTPLAANVDMPGVAPSWLRAIPVDVVATAHAHGDPVTGDISWLFFHVPGHDDVVVLTTEGTWTPDAAAWALLKEAGTAEITAEIVTAYMTQNRVTDGPYRSAGVRRFRIDGN